MILFRLEEIDADRGRQRNPLRRSTSRRPAAAAIPTGDAAPAAETVADEMPGAAVAPQTLRDGFYTRPPRTPRSRRRMAPRMPVEGSTRAGRVRRRRFAAARAGLATLAVLAVLAAAAVLAVQAVYFVGTDSYGQVTIYNGLPYTLPGGVHLYTEYFVSSVTAAELSPLEQRRLFNDELRSQSGASTLVRQLELGQVQGQ